MINHYTLDVFKMALLAKVLLYDPQAFSVKIKILKILHRKPKKSGATVVVGYNLKSNDILQPSQWINLKEGDEVKIQMNAGPGFHPGKWVQHSQYWDQVSNLKNDQSFIFLSQGFEFEATNQSSEKLKKIELFFDEASFEKKVAEFSDKELHRLVLDQDYFVFVLDEIMRRKTLNLKTMIESTDSQLFGRILHYVATKFPAALHFDFWRELAQIVERQTLPQQMTFVQQFNQHSRQLPMKQRFSILEKFSVEDKELGSLVSMIFYEIKNQVKEGKFDALPISTNLFLKFYKENRTEVGSVSIADFFLHLPAEEKKAFFEQLSNLALNHIQKRFYLDQYSRLLDYFNEHGTAKTAWMWTTLPFEKLGSQERDRLLNAVLSMLLKFENLESAVTRKKVLEWINPYVAWAQYPASLDEKTKKAYLELGGYVYSELDILPLDLQKNNTELAAKFRYYFDRAIYVNVSRLEKRSSFSTIEIQVLDAWGEADEKINNPNSKSVFVTNSKLKKDQTLFLAISKESVDIIEKNGFKKMILGFKNKDSKFLVFEESFLSQITDSFR